MAEVGDGLKIVCGAKTRSGGICKKSPYGGRTRCEIHGGKSLRGIDSPRFKHGRYSKVLPARLAAKYEERVDDVDILSMIPDIALLDSRLEELLESASISTTSWEQLRQEYRKLNRALRDNDEAAARESLRAFSQIITEGAADAARWRDVVGVMKERRQLVDTERKLAYDEKNAIQTEAILVMQQAILSIIHEHVTDKSTRVAIGESFRRLLGSG